MIYTYTVTMMMQTTFIYEKPKLIREMRHNNEESNYVRYI